MIKKILQVQPAFIDRTQTDQSVLEIIESEHGMKTKPVTETLRERRLTLLGHVIRAPTDDPMRAITFNTGTVDTLNVGRRRVGRPNLNWIEVTMQ